MRLTIDLSQFDVDLLANRHEARPTFRGQRYMLLQHGRGRYFHISPRVNEEPVSACVVAIPTSSSEAAAAPTSPSLQSISIVAIIVVVVVVVVVIG